MVSSWSLNFCAGYIVPPCKNRDQTAIHSSVVGSSIPISSIPSSFFGRLFSQSFEDYPVCVSFNADGNQNNTVRSKVRTLAFGNSTEREDCAKELAHRLASVTDHRSPTGLFVVIVGSAGALLRVSLWKFPADEILQAEVHSGKLVIRLVPDAFSRESTYFKAAVFEGPRSETSFWRGRIEDLQSRYTGREASAFWTEGFLQTSSDLTDSHGTRLLSRALREALDEATAPAERESIMSAATVVKMRAGQTTTIAELAHHVLPDSVSSRLMISAGTRTADTPFRLDPEVLEQQLRFQALLLDNGYSVKGPLEGFEEAVRVESIQDDRVRVSVEGTIEAQRVTSR